jgi:hypothetical protein
MRALLLATVPDWLYGYGLLMGTFMLLASPFAAILLFSDVRDRVSGRKRSVMLLLMMFVGPACLSLLVPPVLESLRPGYVKFVERDEVYYVRFSRACQAILSQRSATGGAITATDKVVPRIIRDLHPADIRIRPDGLVVRFHRGDRLAWGVSWLQDETATNIWRLQAGGVEAPDKVLYAVTNF